MHLQARYHHASAVVYISIFPAARFFLQELEDRCAESKAETPRRHPVHSETHAATAELC